MAALLKLTGDVDAEALAEHRALIGEAIVAHPGTTLTLRLDEVTFIDSSGLGLLVWAVKTARRAGGDLVFTRPQERVWQVFTATGLDKALPFDPTDGDRRAVPVVAR